MFSWEIYQFFKLAASVLLSSDNLLTDYEQLSYYQFNRNLSFLFYKLKVFQRDIIYLWVDSSYIKSSIKTYQLVFYKQNSDSCCVKLNVYVLIIN